MCGCRRGEGQRLTQRGDRDLTLTAGLADTVLPMEVPPIVGLRSANLAACLDAVKNADWILLRDL